MKLMSAPLALGQAVHEAIEAISILPTQTRFSESLVVKFNHIWEKVSGEKGGFFDADVEAGYKNRGEEMLLRIMKNPGPLANAAVKIKEPLPHFWISEEKNIILCGKVDWLEYIPATDSVHIIDFKTSKKKKKMILCSCLSTIFWSTEHKKDRSQKPVTGTLVCRMNSLPKSCRILIPQKKRSWKLEFR
jgi:hypothetical protein